MRVLFVVAWALAGWRDAAAPSDVSVGLFGLVFIFAGSALTARFYLVRPYLRADRKSPSFKPSWFENPGDPNQPFQFLHMCAFAFVAMALSSLLHGSQSVAEAASPSLSVTLLAGSIGLGTLLGMYWAVRSHPTEFVRRRSDVT